MRVTDKMVEAACDALDDACVAFHRDGHPNASVHWKGFMRADRIGVMRAALEAALSHAAGQEVVAWILRTGHGTALHEGSRPPVEGVGWRPLVIAPAVARSDGGGLGRLARFAAGP